MVNKKHLLIGCSAVLDVAVVLLAVGAYFFYRAVRESMAEISKPPPELSQTGVLVGDGVLAKDVFSNDHRLSQVQAMAFGSVEPGEPDELCSVSAFGATFLDPSGAAKRYIPYGMQQVKVLGMKLQAAGARVSRFQIIDLGGTGECSFLARGGPMGAELIGHDGKSVWLLGGLDPRTHATDMIAGDLNGDGKTEFVGVYEFGDKVVLYDASLNELWSKTEMQASHVELVEAEGGKKSIACSDYKRINFLDSQGNLLKTLEIPTYFHEFKILNWPPRSPTQYLMCHDEDRVDLYDLNGKLRFTCDMPGGSHLERVTAEAFTVGKVSYLAVLGSSRWSGNRSLFCVYGLPERPVPLNQVARQSPVYREVLDQSCSSMTKLPADESGQESILLGGIGQILRYRPVSLPSVPSKPLTSSAGQGKRRSPTGP
jgi:hypothetical protein